MKGHNSNLAGRMKIKILLWLACSFPHRHIRSRALQWMGFEVGPGAYIGPGLGLATMLSENSCHLCIGERASLGPRIMLILASDPNDSRLKSIFPPVRGTINIEADAWLGANVTVLPNIRIGKCSVVAAGAVVTEDVPPYTVVAGVPAKKIRSIDPGLIP